MIKIPFDVLICWLGHFYYPYKPDIRSFVNTTTVIITDGQRSSVGEKIIYSLNDEEIKDCSPPLKIYIGCLMANPEQDFPEFCQKHPDLLTKIKKTQYRKPIILPPYSNVLDKAVQNEVNSMFAGTEKIEIKQGSALEFLAYLTSCPYSPDTRCRPLISEKKKWLDEKRVIINELLPLSDDLIELPIKQLIFFPGTQEQITII